MLRIGVWALQSYKLNMHFRIWGTGEKPSEEEEGAVNCRSSVRGCADREFG